MKKRSAEAGILGFTYQFIQTATKILKASSLDALFTVEGIEDLDISTAKESELIQYKYHEQQKYIPSSIQKPIALMFKHFVENHLKSSDDKVKYTLFCYFGIREEGEDQSNLISSVEELKKILKLKKASEILKGIEWDKKSGLEEEFLSLLSFANANDFETAYEELIQTLSQEFSVTIIESKVRYFSNAVFHINNLAIKKDIQHRKITKRDFIDLLNSDSKNAETAIIERLYGRNEYINNLKQYLEINNVKPNTKNHIFFLTLNLSKTPRLIVDLAQKFVEKDRPNDHKPITVVVDAKLEEMHLLKKEVSELTVREKLNLIFNDGNEDYYFNPQYFNKKIIAQLKGNRRIQNVSYNYKLISFNNFIRYQDDILYESPFYVFADNSINYEQIKHYSKLNKIVGSSLNDKELLTLFGGK